MQEMLSPAWKDPLQKGTATHYSILAGKIPPTEKPDGLQSIGLQELDVAENIL